MQNIYLVLEFIPHPFGGAGWFQARMAFTSKRAAQRQARLLSPKRLCGTSEVARVQEIHLVSAEDLKK